MKENTIVLIVVTAILVILLISIQLPMSKDGNLTNNSTNSSINGTVRQMDNAYLQWTEVTSRSMRMHVSDIANATNVGNYSNLETIGMYLSRDAEMSLNQSRYLEISSGLESSLIDIQRSLEDYIIVGKYVETGGKNHDDKLLMDAANYAKNASDHMTNASTYVRIYKIALNNK